METTVSRAPIRIKRVNTCCQDVKKPGSCHFIANGMRMIERIDKEAVAGEDLCKVSFHAVSVRWRQIQSSRLAVREKKILDGIKPYPFQCRLRSRFLPILHAFEFGIYLLRLYCSIRRRFHPLRCCRHPPFVLAVTTPKAFEISFIIHG